jgi:hypothetical protein
VPTVKITREKFLEDNQGRTYLDVVNDPAQPFDTTLDFFNDENKQRRMEESEIHHDRPPLAGIVRELESIPILERALAEPLNKNSLRFRQSIGVLIRMIMGGTKRVEKVLWVFGPTKMHRITATTLADSHFGLFVQSATFLLKECLSIQCESVTTTWMLGHSRS